MGKKGMLDFGKAGFAMPVTNSAYPKPTFHSYIENLQISYETDYDAVAPFLLAELEFADEVPVANIDLVNENNIICGTVSRPSNMPLVTIAMSPTEHLDAPEESCDMTIDLRYIPGVDPEAGPDVCQLVASEVPSWPDKLSDGLVDVWTGEASVTFHCQSAQDPWYKNPVKRIISASYGNYSKEVKPGYVLHDYLK